MSSAEITPEVIFIAETYLIGNLLPIIWGSALFLASAHFVSTSSTEKKGIRNVVIAAMILCLIQVALAFGDSIRSFGTGFGNVVQVCALSPVSVANILIGGITACLVQSFYAWRCFRLLGNRYLLLAFLSLLILFSFASMIAACVMGLISDEAELFTTGSATSFIFFRLPYIAAVATDLILCGLTLLALHRARSLGSPQGVGKFLKTLVLLTVSSNGLTTSFCLVLLITSKRAPGAFWCLMLSSADVYVFTLLVWLYSRRSTNAILGMDESAGSHGHARGVRRASHFRNPSDNKFSFAGSVQVKTDRVTVVSHDDKGETSSDDFSLNDVQEKRAPV